MSAETLPSPPSQGGVKFDRWSPSAGLVALVGGVLTAVLMFLPASMNSMLGSYLWSFIFWAGITMAFFGLSLLHHTVRGSWGVSVIRMLEAGGGYRMLLTFILLFLPIVFGMHILYEWTNHAVVAQDPVLSRKTWYLNEVGFVGRTVVVLLLWAALAWGMAHSTKKQDVTKDFTLESARSGWGAVGLVMFMLTMTMLFTDWGMSLRPHWFSTIYPLWNLVGAMVCALALVTLLVCVNADKEPYRQIVSPKLTRDLGNLLFALNMFWGYVAVSQYLIIWNGNIPEFSQFYATRSENGWNAIGAALILGHFIIPWFALLSTGVKRDPMRLARVCGWLIAMHVLDTFYIVIPDLHQRPAMLTLYDVLAFLTLGAIWFLVFSLTLRQNPLLPKYDNRLQEDRLHAH